MEKIHNNLNIENLIKTKAFNKLTVEQKEELLIGSQWIKQFHPYQREEILTGITNNVDILIYAKKEYNSLQMSEIRLGLEDNLDVSVYANPKTDYVEMKKIRLKLKEKKNEKQNT